MPAEPEVLDRESAALELRKPGIPTTIAELALRKGEAKEIIEARIQVLETARRASIRATHPEDWLLFKAPDEQGGQIVGYLQDSGCERVRDIFGISVLNVSAPEKIAGVDPNVFHYLVSGDGHCTLTAQSVESLEGGRSSTEDFCRGKEGAALELAVRKAARANLDGQIVRELAGLAQVPIAELEAAWTGTHKKVEQCRRGRGFGTKEERHGGDRADAPKLVPPNCPHCGTAGVYKTNARGGFYSCPRFKSHEDKRWFVDVKEWEKDPRSKPQAAAQPAAEPPHQQTTSTGAPAGKAAAPSLLPDEPPPITDGDIDFGGGRSSSSSSSRRR